MSTSQSQTVSLGQGPAVLAFDVGGTDMKTAVVDQAGVIRSISRVPTPQSMDGTGDAVLAEVGRIAAELRAQHPELAIEAAGLIVPGLVDDEEGIGVFAENLGWRDVPFRNLATQRLGVPVSFTHDVRAAGEAEYRLGAAGSYGNVMVVVIGTGIASAIFIDGKPYSAHGFAGEIGHSIIVPDGPECACGGRGCLESIASAGAIVRRYNGASDSALTGAKDVLALAQSGNATASTIWSEATDALGLAFAQSVALLAPEAIVLGGGLAQAGAALIDPVAERLDSLLTFHRRPALIRATVGEDAGLVGAALRARDLVSRQHP